MELLIDLYLIRVEEEELCFEDKYEEEWEFSTYMHIDGERRYVLVSGIGPSKVIEYHKEDTIVNRLKELLQ